MRHNFWNVISTLVDIGVSDDQQNPCRRTFDQAAGRLKHRNASPFGSHQRLRYLKAIFRKKKIQVVSGNPPRNTRIALPNQISIFISQRFQAGVNLASPAAFTNDSFQFLIAGGPNFHPHAVVGQNVELLDVVIGFARHDRVHAA